MYYNSVLPFHNQGKPGVQGRGEHAVQDWVPRGNRHQRDRPPHPRWVHIRLSPWEAIKAAGSKRSVKLLPVWHRFHMAVCLRGRRAGRIVLAYLALVMTHEPELKHIKRQITHNAATTRVFRLSSVHQITDSWILESKESVRELMLLIPW